MLGTNDFQSMHDFNAWHSAQGTAALVRAILSPPIEPGMPTPQVLIVAPPPVRTPRGSIAAKFADAGVKGKDLAAELEKVAAELGCAFFDAGKVVTTSAVDGVHLDADQHLVLAHVLAQEVASLLDKMTDSAR